MQYTTAVIATAQKSSENFAPLESANKSQKTLPINGKVGYSCLCFMQWNEFRSHIGYLSARQQQRVREAFDLGKKMHKEQLRKSGEPYFSHPIAVANMLADMHADSDTIIAALLHDTIEDTPLTVREIETAFGTNVGALIDGLTKLCAADVAERPNLNEQIETLRKMFALMEKDVRIMVIKLVDRLHNMQTAEFLPPERQRALAEETLDVYVKIADRLCMQDLRDELEGLAIAVLEPEMFAKLSELRAKNELMGEKAITAILGKIGETDPGYVSHFQIQFEPKTWDKRRAQLQTEGATVTGIAAIAVVFVCKDTDACYRTLGLLHQLWKREVMSFQDFINTPAINGYQGLHTTIILEDGTRIRCKLRTAEMHAYARKGIVLACFKRQKSGLMESLPWAERISPLTQDTKGQSAEFWKSLQSDILGESIVIYGPANQPVIVPKGSTALDGAFHVFREEALKINSISIEGKNVDFSLPLHHSVSLNVEFGETPAVSLKWLESVKTGFAVAKIRSALAESLSEAEKRALGRNLLQKALHEQKRGFIEEFDEKTLDVKLHDAGYSSLDSAYAAIADGRADAAEIYRILFKTTDANKAVKRNVTIIYNINMDDLEAMDRLNLIHRQYGPSLSEIRYRRLRRNITSVVTIRARLTAEEESALVASLERAGAARMRRFHRYAHVFSLAAILILFVLWGLDPVAAGVLLHQWNISPVDLTVIRFWTLVATSGILLLWTRVRNPRAEERLSLRNASLWMSAVLLACVAITTYAALLITAPSHYTIPMTAAGLLLTSIVNRQRRIILLITWLCLLGGVIILIAMTPGWSPVGIVLTAAAVAAFSLFIVVSERYKRDQHVDIRAAQYFFVLSLGCAVFTLPLLPFSSVGAMAFPAFVRAMLFSFLFAGLPYYIYYRLLSRRALDFVLRYSFLIIFATVIGQAAIAGEVAWRAVIPAGALVTAGAVLPLFKIKETGAL